MTLSLTSQTQLENLFGRKMTPEQKSFYDQLVETPVDGSYLKPNSQFVLASREIMEKRKMRSNHDKAPQL